ncbi:MAG: ABC transporter permease [Gammaproteobacteria bacterium]|nr:ABC transporter permease [Gammaproteobacteria bacterium]
MTNNSIANILTGLPGRYLLKISLYIINLATFSTLALRDWYSNNRIFNKKSYSSMIAQIIFTGIDALPTITLLGLAAGFVFTFRLIAVLDSIGAKDEIVNLLVNIICLGIGPFLAAIILISRTGSAIVVDLGNMKLHGEIEGLEMLGININNYLIAPRLIGCAISQLAITVYFTFIALVFGITISGLFSSSSHFELLTEIGVAFTPYLVMVFITKNLLFGYVIAAISCYNGLRVHISPTEVPQQATRAIVNGLVAIFVIEGLLALALL